MDNEDLKFLQDLVEELRAHEGVYEAEAVELENIIFRVKEENKMNWQKILFECSKCGVESWQEFDVNTYVLKVDHLICDGCFVEEED